MLIIAIKVAPGSGRQECVVDKSGRLKCFVKSQAEQGKANQELIRFLAKKLHTTQEKIAIVQGLTSKNKKIKIDLALTFDALLGSLGIEVQKTVFDK